MLSARKEIDVIETVPPAFVRSDNLQIHYRCFGSGAPLILVHGWGADLQSNWRDTGWVDTLAEHHHVIALDVRGHGLSDKPHESPPYSYAAMSADVIAVMDDLDVQQCAFMGYSMGAFMGAWLLGHRPGRFTAMILGGIGDESEQSAAQGEQIAAALRAPVEQTASAVRTFVEQNANNDLEALACSALQMWPEGYPLKLAGADIARAAMPVLIVNGANDHPYVDTADAFAAALPNASHLRISDRDHLSVVADARFKAAVVEFLSDLAD